MAALDRWNDDRLDDLQREVLKLGASFDRLHENLGSVAVLAEQIKGVRSSIDDVNRDLESVGGNPLAERRERRKLIVVGIVSGVTTGSVGGLVALLTGVHP